jgi:hypothetical protein
MTRKALMRARSEITASVMPSAKYSWVGSCEMLRNGRTAMLRIVPFAGTGGAPLDPSTGSRLNVSATVAAEAGRRARSFSRQDAIRSSSSAPASGRRVRNEGAGVLTIANISACGRSCANGRCPVASSNSVTPSA